MDCDFQCPSCECNLSEYMLRKVFVGLHDLALKQEMFRQYHTYGDVENLRAFCVSFEAAQRDSTLGGKNAWEYESAGADIMPDDVNDDDVASRQPSVAASGHNASNTHKSCHFCGYKHAPDKGSCPAQHATCVACGKPGHFKRTAGAPGSVGLARQ